MYIRLGLDKSIVTSIKVYIGFGLGESVIIPIEVYVGLMLGFPHQTLTTAQTPSQRPQIRVRCHSKTRKVTPEEIWIDFSICYSLGT